MVPLVVAALVTLTWQTWVYIHLNLIPRPLLGFQRLVRRPIEICAAEGAPTMVWVSRTSVVRLTERWWRLLVEKHTRQGVYVTDSKHSQEWM